MRKSERNTQIKILRKQHNTYIGKIRRRVVTKIKERKRLQKYELKRYYLESMVTKHAKIIIFSLVNFEILNIKKKIKTFEKIENKQN